MTDKRARFEAQVLPHLDAAYRFSRWLSRAPGDADDLVQEAMLRAFRGFEGLRGSDVKTWLLTIVRNTHYTAIKQRQRRGFVPLPAEDDLQDGHVMIASTPDPESASMSRDTALTLNGLIAALPEEHRSVLILREIEALGYAEIAAVVGVPIGTVMSRLARARASLRVLWAQQSLGKPRAVR